LSGVGLGMVRLERWRERPTLVTLVMCPFLVTVYARLARREERDSRAQFGVESDAYAGWTPAFIPRLRRSQQAAAPLAS
jgi:methanethiol S-methyltransferase